MGKLTLEDWADEKEWDILAISTHAQDYFVAYQLNKLLGTRLKNFKAPYVTKKNISYCEYSCFLSQATSKTPNVYLICNQSFNTSNTSGLNGLFDELESTMRIPLISTLKRWDFALISDDYEWIQKRLTSTKNIFIAHKHFIYKELSKEDKSVLTLITNYEQG